MGQFLYEKPREKLVRVGVASLTNVELLQVVIGSGTTAVPVRKLARKVNRLLIRRELQWSFEDLCELKGIGVAKAGVLVAAFELASRFVDRHQGQVYGKQKDFLRLISRITPTHEATAWLYLFDGASRLIGRSDIHYGQDISGEHLATRMLREAVRRDAVSVYIAFTKKKRGEALSIEELAALRAVSNAGKLMTLDIKGIATVSEGEVTQYDKGVI